MALPNPRRWINIILAVFIRLKIDLNIGNRIHLRRGVTLLIHILLGSSILNRNIVLPMEISVDFPVLKWFSAPFSVYDVEDAGNVNRLCSSFGHIFTSLAIFYHNMKDSTLKRVNI